MLVLTNDIPRHPGLGWLGVLDNEDKRKANHPLRAHRLVGVESVRKNIRYPSFSWPYDQGRTGTCVGHGGKYKLITSPVIQTKRLGTPTPADLYLKATTYDPWHGGQPDTSLQDGTSITALFQAFKAMGYCDEYDWTDEIDDVLDFMCAGKGGVVFGLAWRPGMFRTTKEGILDIDWTESIIGGHCIFCDWIDWKRGLAGGPNSWGRPLDFGKINLKTGLSDGRWLMDLNKLRRLLKEGGDAVASVELRAA